MTAEATGSVWWPLAQGDFRRLYIVYVSCFVAAAILEASAAWDLADRGASEWLVALASTAATLPIVLLILPFGALADTGRRLGLMQAAQILTVFVAAALAIASILGQASPAWLLTGVALAGLAMAMRLPALTSMVPGLLPDADLPNGMTLLGVATSLTRFIGPVAAAGAISLMGSAAPYLVTAAISLVALALLRRLPSVDPEDTLPAERTVGAIRVARQFTAQSPEFRRLLLRGAAFFFFGAAAQALAPLAASRNLGGGVATFMSVIGATGLGAVMSGVLLPRLRARLRRTEVARLAAVTMGTGALCVAFAPNAGLAFAGAFLHGAGWLGGLATFTSLAQQSLPEWVRARGMAVTHAALIGGVAIGAAIWGQVASLFGLTATLCAAACGCIAMAAVRSWLMLLAPVQRELSPNRYWSEPALAISVSPEDGPAVVLIEYHIRDGAEDAFLKTLRKSRQLRLRSGALSWSLFRDIEDRNRFTEQVLYESWNDRLRQAYRTTEADALVRDKKLTLLTERSDPRVAHWVAVQV